MKVSKNSHWQPQPVVVSADKFDAVLFDMDGVVTKTADLHAFAWKQCFDEFFLARAAAGTEPFDIDRDYHLFVDGRARYTGVQSFLLSRNLTLSWGDRHDAPGFSTVCALGNLKNQKFLELLENHPVEAYETTVSFIRSLKRKHVKVAVITASENGAAILKAANLLHVFDVRVDGLDAIHLGLKSKPAPDVFIEAARQLGVHPARALVIEDAIAGVEAGHRGNFGLVIGVDRNNNAVELKQHGADVVVGDLSDVKVAGEPIEPPELAQPVLNISDENWLLRYSDFVPALEGRREALCAVGNGYFATRAASPESFADGVHAPGTYVAGVYNRLRSESNGVILEHEDLVNIANWLPLTFRVENGAWFDLSRVEILKYEQVLNLREGILHRQMRFKDPAGHEITLSERRFVHMRYSHLAGLEITLIAHNWSGTVTVRSALDGRVLNNGTAMYALMNKKHLEPIESNVEGDVLYLKMCTNQSCVTVAEAAFTSLAINGKPLDGERRNVIEPDYVAQDISITVSEGDRILIRKIVSLFTSRDSGISEAGISALEAVNRSPHFDSLVEDHIQAWRHLWNRFDLALETAEGNAKVQPSLLLHLHSFHVLQTASPNSVDLDVGVPARGWVGEGYQGHVFWDALFVFPFLNLRMPEITQSLLKYRYRRLDEARQIAREMGVPGARYPWQSGSNGREETPKYVWSSGARRWMPDYTHLQVHINAAIAVDIWHYYQVSGNLDFMYAYGAEMLFEIARFFAHFARYNPQRNRYEIHAVVGPDEYHSAYPETDKPGINNNAYTNVMAAWTISRAVELVTILPEDHGNEICERLKITDDELAHWEKVSRQMFVPFRNDGIINQFEGYETLAEFPWRKEGRIDTDRLHQVLDEQDGNLNQFQVSKQADVLMLFYLFSAEELEELFERLGYDFRPETIPENIDFYINRTADNSTLSRVVHAWVLSRMDRPHAWKLLSCMSSEYGGQVADAAAHPLSWDTFLEALGSDFFDIQGGTTAEGIHMGAMAGTVDIVQRCYTGLATKGDVLWLNPRLPETLTRLSFNLHYRHQEVRFELTQETAKITTGQSITDPIQVGFKNKVYKMSAGESKVFHIASGELYE